MTADDETDSTVPPPAPPPRMSEPAEPPEGEPPSTSRRMASHAFAAVREFVTVAAIAIVLSFLVKTFLVQPFYIPSESMENTLVKGDRVIVSKLTPAPFDLAHGDVIVFVDPGDWLGETPTAKRSGVIGAVRSALTFVGLLPNDSQGHLIKRLIGLPGDHIVCCDAQNHLTVNGVSLDEPYVKAGEDPSDLIFDITVPAGKVWVMGDNRGHSSDSRLHDPAGDGKEGSIDESLIVGRAVLTIWPFDRVTWLSDYPATFGGVPDPSKG